MQLLSALKSDPLYFPYLCNLEGNHHSERLSDNIILRREPKNLEILRAAQDDNYSLRGACPERLDLRTSSEPPFGPSSRPRAVELRVDRSCRRAQNDSCRHSVGCRTVFPVYFREKEIQNQRHEVCLNIKGLE